MTVASLALAWVVGPAPTTPDLLRFPDIHGDTVTFVYGGDIWTATVPDGLARRLTTSAGSETTPRFSPDGKWIAFSGQYDSAAPQVYVVPTEGGDPKRLTFENVSCTVTGWTPDGKVTYASSFGSTFTPRLWMVGTNGSMPERTELAEYSNGSISADGRQIAYNRNNSYTFNWRYYGGGTQGRICFWDFDKKTYWEAPAKRDQNYWPMWVGDNVYFLSDKGGPELNIWAYNTVSKRQEQLTDYNDGDIKNPANDDKSIVFERNGGLFVFNIATRGVSQLKPKIAGDLNATRARYRKFGDSVDNFDVSPSGKRLAVEARGEIYSVPATSGETRNLTNTIGARETQPNWSPDGQEVYFVSDRDGDAKLYRCPQMGGDAKLVRLPAGHVIRQFAFIGDGSKIAYFTADQSLYIVDKEGGTPDRVYDSMNGGGAFDVSQNGEWVAYTKVQPNLFNAVMLYNTKTKQHTKVTEGYYSDDAVAFDRNGKYLYLVSGRTYGVNMDSFGPSLFQQDLQRVYVVTLSADATNPLIAPGDEEPGKPEGDGSAKKEDKPVDPGMKVDVEGLADRMVALPWPNSNYPFLIGVDNGVLTFSNGALVKFDMGSRSPQTIVSGASGFSLNEQTTKIAYRGPAGIGISDLRPGIDANSGRVSTGDIGRYWDPRAEWEQIFWEAWRWERDVYYDPGMVGVDWNAVGRKYAALLPSVSNRNDLNYLLGLMIGELGTGHAYITAPGETGFTAANVPVGYLGADYSIVGGKVKFAKIYHGLNFEAERRGPLGAPGVKVNEGDYLLEINGEPVSSADNFHKLLVDKVDKNVTLTVNSSASMSGARKVVVRPVANEGSLRYISWVEANRKYVEKMSGGRIGYMHVPNTNFQGIIEFIKGYYSNGDKEAMVIDERYNGGGFIPTFFVEYLMRTVQTGFKGRYGMEFELPTQTPDGPKVMLINEFAGSGGDMFPWLFKRNKVGPLIGTRTWGGLVGISGGVNLVDGGGVTAPGFGIYDTDKREWIAESRGVDPDIEVDARPDLIAQGKDPVLDKGIEVLTKQLPMKPKGIAPPAFPKVRRDK